MQNSKTIDEAKKTCSDKVNIHRNKSREFLMYVLFSLISFVAFIVYEISSDLEARRIISDTVHFMDSLDRSFKSDLAQDLALRNQIAKYIDFIGVRGKILVDTPRLKDQVDSLIFTHYSPGISANRLITALDSAKAAVQQASISPDGAARYILYGIFILVFSVFTSFYRFHTKEAAKYEHFLIGFYRINIAGEESATKFDDVVKESLSADAFSLESKPVVKAGRIESAVPGHPGSDVAASVLNKLFDGFDWVAKPKK